MRLETNNHFTIDDAAGIVAGRIVVPGATSVKAPTADNEALPAGVTLEAQAVQNDPVSVATGGVAGVEILASVVAGEYCVVGNTGVGKAESGFKTGAELFVVGTFLDTVTYSSSPTYARVQIRPAKRFRRNIETITGTGAQTASADGFTKMNRGASIATTVTIPDGTYEGQEKTVVNMDSHLALMSLSVTNHVLGSPTTISINGQYTSVTLKWNGSYWYTITCNNRSNGVLYARAGTSVEAVQNFTYDPSTGEIGVNGGLYVYFGPSSSAAAMIFEGATGDGFETTVGAVDPVADRTLKIPNAAGTLSCVLHVDTAAVANVLTGEDDLQTWSMPANTLMTAKDTVRITDVFTFAANAGNKRIRKYLGSTAVFDTTAIPINGGSAKLVTEITRVSATAQQVICAWISGSAILATVTNYTTPAEDLSTSLTVKATGEGILSDDIVQEQTLVEYLPAP